MIGPLTGTPEVREGGRARRVPETIGSDESHSVVGSIRNPSCIHYMVKYPPPLGDMTIVGGQLKDFLCFCRNDSNEGAKQNLHSKIKSAIKRPSFKIMTGN